VLGRPGGFGWGGAAGGGYQTATLYTAANNHAGQGFVDSNSGAGGIGRLGGGNGGAGFAGGGGGYYGGGGGGGYSGGGAGGYTYGFSARYGGVYRLSMGGGGGGSYVFGDYARYTTGPQGSLPSIFGDGQVEILPAAVPEPSEWMLMVLGLGFTAAMLRRERNRRARAATVA
jgi:hypothetical protein